MSQEEKKKPPSPEQLDRWSKVTPSAQPIFQTSVYDYPDLETLDDFYNGLIPNGYMYSRNGLPNSNELAKQVAALENTEEGLVCSTGMGALTVALLSFLGRGSHVVASNDLYGGTTVLLKDELPRFGIETSFINPRDGDPEIRSKFRENTKMVLIETISNPSIQICDIGMIADLAHSKNALLVVDNTFASPFVVRPADLGADIVMHSGTKFLGGHHDVTIGVLCGRSKEMKRMAQFNTRIGTMAGPFDSWLSSRSVSTWKLRVEKCCENALKLAEYLESRTDKVSKVYYPGLASNPQHELATRIFQEKNMFGGMLSFDLRNGLEHASVFAKSLRSVAIAPSLGGVKTTISHPGKTSHRYVSEEQKKEIGITDAMIRVSVGIEDYEEIRQDFASGS